MYSTPLELEKSYGCTDVIILSKTYREEQSGFQREHYTQIFICKINYNYYKITIDNTNDGFNRRGNDSNKEEITEKEYLNLKSSKP